MANQEQVALLKQGSEVWNAWRKENRAIQIDLSTADFRNANLRNADLSFAYLGLAKFDFADLSHARLIFSKMGGASLSGTNLINANLSTVDLSIANLIEVNLSNANLSYANLSTVNFTRANLSNTDLSYAGLGGANFTRANLSNANLVAAQALRTNFQHAILTRACIQDLQIGDLTILKNIQCDYIFRSYNYEEKRFSGRLPVDPESTFSPGEFTQRFQIIASALETIDITFTEGIDWQAFFQSFQDLRASHPGEDISIQGMERNGDAFIVRLEVQAEVDKAAIETEVKQRYAHQLVALEAQYEERLRLQGAHLEDAQRTIDLERQRNTEFMGIIGIMAQNQGSKYDMRGSNFGQFVDTAQSGSRVQSIQHIYAPEQQDLSEAAQEIQALLNTLSDIYNTTTDAGKEQMMKEVGKEVEKHPKWRRALKAGGIELIKVLCVPIGVPLEMARVYLEDED